MIDVVLVLVIFALFILGSPKLAAVPFVCISAIIQQVAEHRERMAKIKAGIDPDKE